MPPRQLSLAGSQIQYSPGQSTWFEVPNQRTPLTYSKAQLYRVFTFFYSRCFGQLPWWRRKSSRLGTHASDWPLSKPIIRQWQQTKLAKLKGFYTTQEYPLLSYLLSKFTEISISHGEMKGWQSGRVPCSRLRYEKKIELPKTAPRTPPDNLYVTFIKNT
jgi:hypothetical protein